VIVGDTTYHNYTYYCRTKSIINLKTKNMTTTTTTTTIKKGDYILVYLFNEWVKRKVLFVEYAINGQEC